MFFKKIQKQSAGSRHEDHRAELHLHLVHARSRRTKGAPQALFGSAEATGWAAGAGTRSGAGSAAVAASGLDDGAPASGLACSVASAASPPAFSVASAFSAAASGLESTGLSPSLGVFSSAMTDEG